MWRRLLWISPLDDEPAERAMLHLDDELAGLVEAADTPADQHGTHSTKPEPAWSVRGEVSVVRSQPTNAILTMPCTVPCRAVLCCAVLCCAVLCCAVLCCAVLCCAVRCGAVRCHGEFSLAPPCCICCHASAMLFSLGTPIYHEPADTTCQQTPVSVDSRCQLLC